MDHQVRAARITDIDRLVTLTATATSAASQPSPLVAPDLLRQLIYLPNASVLVAEAGRALVGLAVLAIRPSVRAGGFIGTIDLLVVDPDRDAESIRRMLIEDLLRSARNKGCRSVEAALPGDPADRAQWIRLGFTEAPPFIQRSLAITGTAVRAS